MSTIHFTIHYRTNQKQKVQGFIDQYSVQCGIEIHDLKIERYWKGKDQLQASFFITTKLTQREEKIFQILALANMLATTTQHSWTFNGPHENGQLVFECIFNNTKEDQPLRWAHIALEDR